MPSFSINFDTRQLQSQLSRIVKKKCAVLNNVEVRNAVARQYKDVVEKYVPMKTGKLRETAFVEHGAVVYPAVSDKKFPYAEVQYRTPFDPSRRTTPGTYDHWDKHLSNSEKERFYRGLAEEIARYMNGQ